MPKGGVPMKGRAPCRTNKVRYRDRIAATIALFRTRDQGTARAYQCDFCHGWHLTSQPLRERA